MPGGIAIVLGEHVWKRLELHIDHFIRLTWMILGPILAFQEQNQRLIAGSDKFHAAINYTCIFRQRIACHPVMVILITEENLQKGIGDFNYPASH
jgi:hypothetical protein